MVKIIILAIALLMANPGYCKADGLKIRLQIEQLQLDGSSIAVDQDIYLEAKPQWLSAEDPKKRTELARWLKNLVKTHTGIVLIINPFKPDFDALKDSKKYYLLKSIEMPRSEAELQEIDEPTLIVTVLERNNSRFYRFVSMLVNVHLVYVIGSIFYDTIKKLKAEVIAANNAKKLPALVKNLIDLNDNRFQNNGSLFTGCSCFICLEKGSTSSDDKKILFPCQLAAKNPTSFIHKKCLNDNIKNGYTQCLNCQKELSQCYQDNEYKFRDKIANPN